jgi:hypothetical protein
MNSTARGVAKYLGGFLIACYNKNQYYLGIKDIILQKVKQ